MSSLPNGPSKSDGMPSWMTQYREMFARYGMAIHACQVIEKQLIQLISVLKKLDPEIHNLRFHKRKRLSELPLGALIAPLRTNSKVEIWFGRVFDELDGINEKRILLVHNFFHEDRHLMVGFSESACKRAGDECEALENELHEFSGRLQELVVGYYAKIGITQDRVDRVTKRLLARIHDPISEN